MRHDLSIMNTISRKLCLCLSLLIACTITSHAQNTPEPRRAIVAPEIPEANGPVEPHVENPDEVIGMLVLSDMGVPQVLSLLEKVTGKIILRRQDIAAAKINFASNEKLTKGEYVLALESLLSLNGVMLTDMGGRFMKAVPATSVNSHVPEMLIGSTLELPASQQIYAKLFKFDYLQAEATSGTTVTPLLSQNSSVVVFPKSNAMLITDALINLQRIERLINEMDKPQEVREEIRFIKLDYVQATEMQQRIENLIQGALKNYLEGNTSVAADERTNQLILITHPGNLGIIMDVIASVDVDAAPLTSSEVFPLRQAQAADVVAIIDEIISGQEEGREEDAKVAKDNKAAADTNNNAATPNNAAPNPAAPAPTTNTAVGLSTSNSSLQFSNFVGLSADERTNAIVAYGTQSDLDTLRELVDKIDRPLPQVVIETVISLVTLTDNNSFGINSLGFTYDGSINTFSDIALGTVGGISISEGVIDLDNPSDFELTTSITSIDENSDGDVKILATPRIIVSHNEEGTINVSKSYPIITSSTTFNSSDGNTNDSVEYRDIGIQLTVTPLIGADGTVQMVIEQTIENVDSEIEINGNKQPIIGKREATSTVSVKDGQIVILGGLQQNTLIDSNSYFPVLSSVPGLKTLFTSASEQYERSEIIIFVRPKVLENPEVSDRVSREYLDGALEANAINQYLETNSTGNIYVEESEIITQKSEVIRQQSEANEEPATEEPEINERPFIRFGL